VSTFTKTFPNRGPRDSDGRSLRDFDLQSRLFRYRLSYMIYSDVFDGLPARLQERVYQRLHDVLTGVTSIPARIASSSAATAFAVKNAGYPAGSPRRVDVILEW
jgi:hypothetical protein